MNRVVHFEILVEDAERAIAFYTHVFGWKIERWGDEKYWMIMTAEKDSDELGINGGLMLRPEKTSNSGMGANAFICTMQVDDFDSIAAKIEKAGGSVAMPKFALPKMAWQGYFTDTEGNTFGIHQPDENAA